MAGGKDGQDGVLEENAADVQHPPRLAVIVSHEQNGKDIIGHILYHQANGFYNETE